MGVSASAPGACPALRLHSVPVCGSALSGVCGVRDTVQLAGWLCACTHPSCSWRLTPRADPDDIRACGGTRSSRGHTESAFLCVITPLPRLTHHPSQSRASPAATDTSVSESKTCVTCRPCIGPGLRPMKCITSLVPATRPRPGLIRPDCEVLVCELTGEMAYHPFSGKNSSSVSALTPTDAVEATPRISRWACQLPGPRGILQGGSECEFCAFFSVAPTDPSPHGCHSTDTFFQPESLPAACRRRPRCDVRAALAGSWEKRDRERKEMPAGKRRSMFTYIVGFFLSFIF